MSKDRAAPFSRKHRRYWIPVTGGMILIMLVNVLIGLLSYPKEQDVHQKMELHLPPPHTPAGSAWMTMDAGAGAPVTPR